MKFLRYVALGLCIPLVACASITSQVDKTGPFLITGSPQTIPTGFPFVSSSELLVLDTGPTANPHDPATVLTLGSDYTVTGGNYNGSNQMQTGSVIVVSSGSHSVATNDYIVILRNVPINQTSSFTTTGPNTVLLLEQMGDKLATLSQQVNQIGSRSLRFENFEFLDGTLSKSSRAGMLLGFDANGVVAYLPTTIVPGTFVSSVTGTSHEVTVTPTTGAAVVSLPTALTFTGKTVTGGTFNALTLTASSVIGVGTTSPVYALDVQGSSPSLRILDTDSGGGGFLLGSYNLTVAGAYEILSDGKLYFSADSVVQGFFASGGLTLTKSLTLSGASARISADFSNATIASRTLFQSSTTNGTTSVGAIPNGAGATGSFTGFNSSSLTDVAFGSFGADATSTFINSNIAGAGTLLAIELRIAGTAKLKVKTSGIVNVVNTPSYADNAAALLGGLVAGDLYRNGDILQIVH